MPEATVKSYARETAIATSILAIIALLYGLFIARVVFMPVVLSLTLMTIFRPPVQWLKARRVPTVLGAPLVVLTALVVILSVARFLAPSATDFAGKFPKALTQLQIRLAEMPAPMNSMAHVIPDMHATAGVTVDTVRARDGTIDSTVIHRTASTPSDGADIGPMVARLFGTATELVSTGLQTALLLIFFLAGSDEWRKKRSVRTHPFAKVLVDISDEVQSSVSRYLAMTALINLGQALLVTLAAWALGLPSPPIWGALTFVAEFLPYLGGFAMVALLLLVGLATSPGLGHALLGPAAYLLITTLQNNVVSPIVYGRGLELNPAAILVSVIIWLFLWGVVGAFLAVPILAIAKIVCERAGGGLEPIAELIAG